MNKIVVTGNLVKDGEYRSTESGKTVYSNSIAVRRSFKNPSGEYDTDFLNFVSWNVSDNFKSYLIKGRQVLLEGRLQTRTYEAKDGVIKHITEIIVEKIELLGGKKEQNEVLKEIPQNIKSNYEDAIVLSDSDLPF